MEQREEEHKEDASDVNEVIDLRDEVVCVYEQLRNLVANMKRSKSILSSSTERQRQSMAVASLHTSIASSDSGDNLTTQFRVKIRLISLCFVSGPLSCLQHVNRDNRLHF